MKTSEWRKSTWSRYATFAKILAGLLLLTCAAGYNLLVRIVPKPPSAGAYVDPVGIPFEAFSDYKNGEVPWMFRFVTRDAASIVYFAKREVWSEDHSRLISWAPRVSSGRSQVEEHLNGLGDYVSLGVDSGSPGSDREFDLVLRVYDHDISHKFSELVASGGMSQVQLVEPDLYVDRSIGSVTTWCCFARSDSLLLSHSEKIIREAIAAADTGQNRMQSRDHLDVMGDEWKHANVFVLRHVSMTTENTGLTPFDRRLNTQSGKVPEALTIFAWTSDLKMEETNLRVECTDESLTDKYFKLIERVSGGAANRVQVETRFAQASGISVMKIRRDYVDIQIPFHFMMLVSLAGKFAGI